MVSNLRRGMYDLHMAFIRSLEKQTHSVCTYFPLQYHSVTLDLFDEVQIKSWRWCQILDPYCVAESEIFTCLSPTESDPGLMFRHS